MCDFMTCFVRNDEIKLWNQYFAGTVAMIPSLQEPMMTNVTNVTKWITCYKGHKLYITKTNQIKHNRELTLRDVRVSDQWSEDQLSILCDNLSWDNQIIKDINKMLW